MAVFNYAQARVAAVGQASHSKGAYQDRDWMDERATLLGFWNEPQFVADITAIYGRALVFPTFERLYRNERGSLSPAERALTRYIQRSLPDYPDYAGQYLQLDGSEVPVEVLNGWGKTRRDGDVHQIMAALTDVLSLRTWLYTEGATSEVTLWSPLLLKYFQETNSAPEKILTDLGGRLFHRLQSQEAGQDLALDPGLRLALAVGVMPANHTAHNARAKGAVESGGIKSAKSSLKRLLVSRLAASLYRELASVPLDSHGHVAYRQIAGQAEWMQICVEWQQALNARLVKRYGAGTFARAAIWALEEYAAKRSERQLAADWSERYRDIICRGFAMRVCGESNRLIWKENRAELRAKLARPCNEGSVAVLFRAGLRKGDDAAGGDLLRGIIIEPKEQGGLPTYHAIEAFKVNKNIAGFDLDRPRMGEPIKALPESEHDRVLRVNVERGNELTAAIRQAKALRARDGTTGEALRIYE